MVDSVTGAAAHKLTRKDDAADPTRRPIVTTSLTPAEHELPTSLPARGVGKRRYPVVVDATRWSLDVLDGSLAPLVIVETQCADDARLEDLTPHPWAGPEISRSGEWQGGALARRGRPEEMPWPRS